MTASSQSLVFTHTPASLCAGIGLVLVMGGLAYTAWKRSGYRRAQGVLESLRVLIALSVAVTLNQPEWREVFEPEFKPTLAVLTDTSRSMETRDAQDPTQPDAGPVSRAELVEPLKKADFWKPVTERMEVAIEPFSSAQTPPEEGSDLHLGLGGTLEKHPRVGAVVLLSDGDWNTGNPPSQAAMQLRMRGIPVFALPIGSESRLPDLQVTGFDVPTFAIAGKPLRIPFTLESSLPREHSLTLELSLSTGETLTKTVTLPAMGKLQDVMVVKPDKPGELTLTLKAPQTGEERVLDNNRMEASLSVRKEQLKVLVIDSFPRWEFRYLRNALERDPGVQVHCLLFHPDLGKPGAGRGYLDAFPKPEDLAHYDVVFLGDVGTEQITPDQCGALRKLVRDQASGLVFLPGLRGLTQSLTATALGDLLPVLLDETQPSGWGTSTAGRLELTEAGRRSLLTQLEDNEEASATLWQRLPGFQWYAPATRAKAGSEVLATHQTENNRFGRIPLLVTKTHGAGKILFMGTDGAWRWRKGVEDKYHYRFWGQVVRWMAYQRTMSQGQKMRLFYAPDRPKLGAALTFNANITSASGEPLREGHAVALITAPSGKTASVRLTPAGDDAWGLFSGVFTPQEQGDHQVHLSCAEAGATLDTRVSIQGARREVIGQPARLDVLREITQLTRGRMLDTYDPKALLDTVCALPKAPPLERRIPLWAHPLWAGGIVLLLGVFWAARKSLGSF
jgi:hypothetical protein